MVHRSCGPRVRAPKIPARNLRHDHTQHVSTQCAELPAEWLGGALSSMPPNSQCAVSGQGSQDDHQPLISATLADARPSVSPNSPCATPDWGSQNELQPPTPTTPCATTGPINSEKYRHFGQSGSARGRSAYRLSGKADRLGRHLQGWCAKVAPATHQCRLSGNVNPWRNDTSHAHGHEPFPKSLPRVLPLCTFAKLRATHDERSERPSPRAVQVVALAVERWRSSTTHAAGHGHVRLLQRCSAPRGSWPRPAYL